MGSGYQNLLTLDSVLFFLLRDLSENEIKLCDGCFSSYKKLETL